MTRPMLFAQASKQSAERLVMEKIGFIGLGTMGTPMALNIRKAGYRLCVWNRNPAKVIPFNNLGITVCATPAEAAAACDVLVIMVFGTEALHAVLQGDYGLCGSLKPGCTVINMSTVSREATLAAAAAVEACGGVFIDAPVAGSKKPAEEGMLTILAGGDKAVVDRMTPLLNTMGRVIIYCGPTGQGTAMKLFINLFLGNLMQSLAEGLCIGSKMGLGLPNMLATIENSAVACSLFKVKGAAIASRNFSKNFSVDLIYKDLALLTEAADKAGVPLPLTAAAHKAFSGARALGCGDEDMAAVIKVIEAVTGDAVRE
jgi:3-hydroxyisobutyrate dehydrogenase-like beta-hydroxyacid dehydrogenase